MDKIDFEDSHDEIMFFRKDTLNLIRNRFKINYYEHSRKVDTIVIDTLISPKYATTFVHEHPIQKGYNIPELRFYKWNV